MSELLGVVIGGSFQKVLMRVKAGAQVMLGTLASIREDNTTLFFQVVDLLYGSQLSDINREFISGVDLEEYPHELTLLDEKQRNYVLAYLKPLVTLRDNTVTLSSSLPLLFSQVHAVDEKDFSFISQPKKSLFFGYLRSGSATLQQSVQLPGNEVLNHHMLIAAQTGKGKSNLTKCLLWNSVAETYCGMLVLDPHNEYYGSGRQGLAQHPDKERVVFYSPTSIPGAFSLVINLKDIYPSHLTPLLNWSEAQFTFLAVAYNYFKENWIERIFTEPLEQLNTLGETEFKDTTILVVRRNLQRLLQVKLHPHTRQLQCKGIFQQQAGAATTADICSSLENAKTVIVDTSHLTDAAELLVGTILTTSIFSKYRTYKQSDQLQYKPSIAIVLEEAPRVIGKDALEKGRNIFSTLAKEGRKFKVGLIAITQLPSLIPKDILANIGTKIILGMELGTERRAIIESAAQDLSLDESAIASLDKGQAVLTSSFSKFAIPFAVPLFEDMLQDAMQQQKTSFSSSDSPSTTPTRKIPELKP